MASASKESRFETLYRQHRLQILAYCLRRTEPTEADDACAETFLVAWRRLDEVPEPPGTLPYLYGIAGRVLSNHRRSIRRRSRLDEKLTNLGVDSPADPLNLTVQNARDREVARAVRGLHPKDREIVMLHTWEDLPRDTIALMMGMSRAAIDQRIHRSYKRLARTLASTVESSAITSPPVAEKGGT